MITKKLQRALIFTLVFAVAMVPVYMMDLSKNIPLLGINIVVAFLIAATSATRLIKKN
ncbi:hypothetical protein O3W44_22555 [Pantoea sp. LMR881]|uniref:hypothetical protein n=1 Tax=Pantoea sp. LMR881 TaxID=3014336 RepID=UPI0022AF5DD4|nr:hypothetical protein [Pantoea sp. LMR881]MCZ4061205.1 hypothetical protein [Pantoea sp. LMR881]MCZ4061316.1 hypothetical protein [Pantoea sp. LMR881]